MANSFIELPVSGADSYTFPFPYLESAHISVFVGGVLQVENTHYSYTSSNVIEFTAGNVPTDTNQYIRISRATAPTGRLVGFSNTGLDADDLNLDSDQIFYMAQEAVDTVETSVFRGVDGTLAVDGRLTGVEDPLDNLDAANKQWVAQQVAGGSGSVTVDTAPPTSPSQGDLWVDTDTSIMYVWTGSDWVNGGTQDVERHDISGSDLISFFNRGVITSNLHNSGIRSITALYLNGVLLKPTTVMNDFTTGDYDILDTQWVTIADVPATDDEITIIKSSSLSRTLVDAISLVNNNSDNIDTVATNIADINSVVTSVIPNLIPITQAAGEASAAAASASLAASHTATALIHSNAASVSKGDAQAAQGLAETAKTDAQTAQGLAESAKTDAETAQGLAESAKTDAETAQTNAETAQTDAETAKTNAQTAQGLAESARDDAQTAQGLAESARDDAQTAKTDAETAQTAAELAETNIASAISGKADLSGATFTGDVDVTGTVTADGGTINGDLQITRGNKLIIGDGDSSTGGLEIYQQASNIAGNHTIIKDSGTGHAGGSIYLQANQLHLQSENGNKYLRAFDDSVVIYDGTGSANADIALRPTDTDVIFYQRGLSFADAESGSSDSITNYTTIEQSSSLSTDTTLTLPATSGNLLVDDGSGNVDISGTVTAGNVDVTGDITAEGASFTGQVDVSSGVLTNTTVEPNSTSNVNMQTISSSIPSGTNYVITGGSATGGLTTNDLGLSVGYTIVIINQSANDQVVTQGAGEILTHCGQSGVSTGSITLGSGGVATLLLTAANSWTILGSNIT